MRVIAKIEKKVCNAKNWVQSRIGFLKTQGAYSGAYLFRISGDTRSLHGQCYCFLKIRKWVISFM